MKTKTRLHKLTAWALTLAMLMTFISSFTFSVSAATINSGSDIIADGNKTNAEWDYVYFGTYNNSPIKWRVLSKNGNGGTYKDSEDNAVTNAMFLLSEYGLESRDYETSYYLDDGDGQEYPAMYEHSDMQIWLNGDFTANAFADKEKQAVLKTTKTDVKETVYDLEWEETELNDETAFLISAREAYDLISETMGLTSQLVAYTADGTAKQWWLRSNYPQYSVAVFDSIVAGGMNGGMTVAAAYVGGCYVRPAINLHSDNILFTSAAVGSKAEAFGEVAVYSGNEYKLTMKDSERSSFTAEVLKTSDGKIHIAYSGAKTGDNEYISAIVKNVDGDITHYGRLGKVAAESGSLEYDMSAVTLGTDDKLYIFNEQYNGDYKTDFASELCEITVPENANAHYVTFNANNGTEDAVSNFVADGDDITPANSVFNYGRYEIASWNTEPDGSGVIYYIDSDITVTEDITLYAQWVLPLNKLESFTDEDYEWSGNDSSPYSFTMKNSAVLPVEVIFPAKSNDDKTTIIVDGDCEIKGSISFDNSADNYKGNLTIKGEGTLKFYEISATGSGDTLAVETDITIENGVNIGASGGMESKVVIKDATLTLHNNLTLLQYLTMDGQAKLNIVGGGASFHDNPEIKLSDKSEIHIGGNGNDCVLYKEGAENKEAFDELSKRLPDGYSFKEYNNGYYLYNAEDNLATGAVAIVKPQSTSRPPSGGGGGSSTRCLVIYESNGGSKVDSVRVTRNKTLEKPENPTKDGYTFGGWHTDEELTAPYDFETKVTKSFTLYAKWDKHDDETDKPGTSDHNCPSLKFSDLDITQWYHLDTDYVIENDIFRGTTETTFAPNAKLTRAMLVTVLYRVEGEPALVGDDAHIVPAFSDVDMGAYYANAVIWAKQNGIVKGISETEFAPNDFITREQIAAILYRYAQYKEMVAVTSEENLHFDDADEISEYAISAMNWAVGAGLIKGYEDNTVRPLNNTTRAEAAALLHRFIEANK